MTTELEQYLFDHQFSFHVGYEDYGCGECEESGDDYGVWNSYGQGVGGHKAGCALAAMLERSGFTVAYRRDMQGCQTVADWEAEQRFIGAARTVRELLSVGVPLTPADIVVSNIVTDRTMGRLAPATAREAFAFVKDRGFTEVTVSDPAWTS